VAGGWMWLGGPAGNRTTPQQVSLLTP
jgi:hypothetical protein